MQFPETPCTSSPRSSNQLFLSRRAISRKQTTAFGLFVAALVAASPASAASIYIDFGSYSAAPSSQFGAAADDMGVWNNVTRLGTLADLLDTAGNSTSVSIAISASSMDGTGGFGTTDAERLMQDNLYSNPGSSWSISLSGLIDGFYDVYLYEPMNRFLGTGSGSVNGIAFTAINGGFTGSFISGGNYLVLDHVVVSGGLLTASGSEQGGLSGISGMQLVDRREAPTTVPEPRTATLLLVALLAVVCRKSGTYPPSRMDSRRDRIGSSVHVAIDSREMAVIRHTRPS